MSDTRELIARLREELSHVDHILRDGIMVAGSEPSGFRVRILNNAMLVAQSAIEKALALPQLLDALEAQQIAENANCSDHIADAGKLMIEASPAPLREPSEVMVERVAKAIYVEMVLNGRSSENAGHLLAVFGDSRKSGYSEQGNRTRTAARAAIAAVSGEEVTEDLFWFKAKIIPDRDGVMFTVPDEPLSFVWQTREQAEDIVRRIKAALAHGNPA